MRADQATADELLGNQHPQAQLLRANFTWQLPTLAGSDGMKRVVGYAVNGWNLSGIWNGATGPYYSLTASHQSGGGNVVLTGSPDYAARVVVLPNVDLGGGCSSDPLASPSDPVTITNLPDPATGVRTVPNGAGFGVANGYQAPRSAQLQIRVAF